MFCQYTYLWMYVIPAADLYHTGGIGGAAVRVALQQLGHDGGLVVAIGESIILLHPPPPLLGVSI